MSGSKEGVTMFRRVSSAAVLAGSLALAATPLLTAHPADASSGPPARFLGQGTTYWEYAGNDGNGSLTVTFDTTAPGLAANQALVKYTFDSGLQPFFQNAGEVTLTGDWSTGWDKVAASPPSHVHVGPFVAGSPISFQVDGYIAVQDGGVGQGPWEVDGSFTPTQGF